MLTQLCTVGIVYKGHFIVCLIHYSYLKWSNLCKKILYKYFHKSLVTSIGQAFQNNSKTELEGTWQVFSSNPLITTFTLQFNLVWYLVKTEPESNLEPKYTLLLIPVKRSIEIEPRVMAQGQQSVAWLWLQNFCLKTLRNAGRKKRMNKQASHLNRSKEKNPSKIHRRPRAGLQSSPRPLRGTGEQAGATLGSVPHRGTREAVPAPRHTANGTVQFPLGLQSPSHRRKRSCFTGQACDQWLTAADAHCCLAQGALLQFSCESGTVYNLFLHIWDNIWGVYFFQAPLFCSTS